MSKLILVLCVDLPSFKSLIKLK